MSKLHQPKRLTIRPASLKKDTGRILELNQAHVPEVSSLTEASLTALLLEACFVRVIEVDQEPEGRSLQGFLLGLDHTAHSYQSKNYAYFRQRYKGAGFVYVDRIVIAPPAKRLGAGTRLYEAFADFGSESGAVAMAAEVNTAPDNPPSHAFHQRLGFCPVGEGRFGDNKAVRYYERLL